MPYVYMLRCSDGTLYVGWTTDVTARVARHDEGTAAKYTRSRRPVTLVYSEPHESKLDAMRREREIKRWPRARKAALAGSPQNPPARKQSSRNARTRRGHD